MELPEPDDGMTVMDLMAILPVALPVETSKMSFELPLAADLAAPP